MHTFILGTYIREAQSHRLLSHLCASHNSYYQDDAGHVCVNPCVYLQPDRYVWASLVNELEGINSTHNREESEKKWVGSSGVLSRCHSSQFKLQLALGEQEVLDVDICTVKNPIRG